jgi:hypothetical protein
MTSTMIIAAVAVVFAAFALIERGTRRREAERAEEYRKEASLRGWKLDAELTRLRYSGTTEGIPWTFESVRSRRQGELRHPSTWETPAVTSDEVILVWPKQAEANIRADVPDFMRKLVFKPLEHVFGVEAELLANAKEDEAMKEVLCDALNDTLTVGVVVSPRGMRLALPVAVATPSEVAKVVALGVRLARTRRR